MSRQVRRQVMLTKRRVDYDDVRIEKNGEMFLPASGVGLWIMAQ